MLPGPFYNILQTFAPNAPEPESAVEAAVQEAAEAVEEAVQEAAEAVEEAVQQPAEAVEEAVQQPAEAVEAVVVAVEAAAHDDDGDLEAEVAIDVAAALSKKKRAIRKPAVVV
jgi:hypothetical protein